MMFFRNNLDVVEDTRQQFKGEFSFEIVQLEPELIVYELHVNMDSLGFVRASRPIPRNVLFNAAKRRLESAIAGRMGSSDEDDMKNYELFKKRNDGKDPRVATSKGELTHTMVDHRNAWDYFTEMACHRPRKRGVTNSDHRRMQVEAVGEIML